MIGHVRGILVSKQPPQLLVEVQGVGYEVEGPLSMFPELPETGQPVLLFTHLVIRDDAHLLFGFLREAQRRLFRSLIKVTGVGPRLALAVLSGMHDEEFRQAIVAKDSARLARVPGIGRKTAERLLVELAGLREEGAVLPGARPEPVGDAVAALVALGYKDHEAAQAVREAAREGGVSSEELIRQALKRMVR